MAAALELLVIPALLLLVIIGSSLVMDFSIGTALAAGFAVAVLAGITIGLLKEEHEEDLEDGGIQ